jgi:hypothetical protein
MPSWCVQGPLYVSYIMVRMFTISPDTGEKLLSSVIILLLSLLLRVKGKVGEVL